MRRFLSTLALSAVLVIPMADAVAEIVPIQRHAVIDMAGRSPEACAREAGQAAVVAAMGLVAEKELNMDPGALRSRLTELAGDRDVIKAVKILRSAVIDNGARCATEVRASIDSLALSRALSGTMTAGAAGGAGSCGVDSVVVPELGALVRFTYNRRRAEDAGLSTHAAISSLSQELLRFGISMISLEPLVDRFADQRRSAWEAVGEDGLVDATASETIQGVLSDTSYLLESRPDLRKPGYLILAGRVDVRTMPRDGSGEDRAEVSAWLEGHVVRDAGVSSLAYEKAISVQTMPGSLADRSPTLAARKAMILSMEAAGRMAATQILAYACDRMQSLATMTFQLENVTSQRKQVRPVIEALSAAGFLSIERLPGGSGLTVQADRSDADRLLDAALDTLEGQGFAGIDYRYEGERIVIILP